MDTYSTRPHGSTSLPGQVNDPIANAPVNGNSTVTFSNHSFQKKGPKSKIDPSRRAAGMQANSTGPKYDFLKGIVAKSLNDNVGPGGTIYGCDKEQVSCQSHSHSYTVNTVDHATQLKQQSEGFISRALYHQSQSESNKLKKTETTVNASDKLKETASSSDITFGGDTPRDDEIGMDEQITGNSKHANSNTLSSNNLNSNSNTSLTNIKDKLSYFAKRMNPHFRWVGRPSIKKVSKHTAQMPEKFPTNIVLRFSGYFQESIEFGVCSAEVARIRCVTICYHVDDDTLSISEAKIANSGLVQGGDYLKRGTYSDISLDKLVPGQNVTINGITIRITDCDGATKKYLLANNYSIGVSETTPAVYVPRPFLTHYEPTLLEDLSPDSRRKNTVRGGIGQTAAGLAGQSNNYGVNNTSNNSNVPASLQFTSALESKLNEAAAMQKQNQSLLLDMNRSGRVQTKEILRFMAFFDEIEVRRFFWIHFYLEDETVEIVERKCAANTQQFGMYFRRAKLEKEMHDLAITAIGVSEKNEYVGIEDLKCGSELRVYGRNFIVYNCDKFTREWYTKNMPKMKQEAAFIDYVLPDSSKNNSKEPTVTSESLKNQNNSTVIPIIPKNFNKKSSDIASAVLRFEAKLVLTCGSESSKLTGAKVLNLQREDEDRVFVVSFYLNDSTLSVYETKRRNSGFLGGALIQRARCRNVEPNAPAFYEDLGLISDVQPQDILNSNPDPSTILEKQNDVLNAQLNSNKPSSSNSISAVSAASSKPIGIKCNQRTQNIVLQGRDLLDNHIIKVKSTENCRDFIAGDFYVGANLKIQARVFHLLRADEFTLSFMEKYCNVPVCAFATSKDSVNANANSSDTSSSNVNNSNEINQGSSDSNSSQIDAIYDINKTPLSAVRGMFPYSNLALLVDKKLKNIFNNLQTLNQPVRFENPELFMSYIKKNHPKIGSLTDHEILTLLRASADNVKTGAENASICVNLKKILEARKRM